VPSFVLGGGWFIYTVLVPALFVTHVMTLQGWCGKLERGRNPDRASRSPSRHVTAIANHQGSYMITAASHHARIGGLVTTRPRPSSDRLLARSTFDAHRSIGRPWGHLPGRRHGRFLRDHGVEGSEGEWST
jgi:hypothetical protein